MKENKVFLNHILDEINFVIKETGGLDKELFLRDEKLKRACARSLEIVGEAVKNISSEYKDKHNSIEWKRIAGLRDKIIHDYFSVDWNIVWDITQNRIPELKDKIEELINHA